MAPGCSSSRRFHVAFLANRGATRDGDRDDATAVLRAAPRDSRHDIYDGKPEAAEQGRDDDSGEEEEEDDGTEEEEEDDDDDAAAPAAPAAPAAAMDQSNDDQPIDELAEVRNLFEVAVILENQSPAGEGAAAAMENLTALLQRLNGRCA